MRLPATVVLAVLVTLGVAPALLHAREQQLYRELQEVLVPARTLVSDYRNAVQRAVSTGAAGRAAGDRALLSRSAYWDRQSSNLAAQLDVQLAAIGPHTDQLWQAVQRRTAALVLSDRPVDARSGSQVDTAYPRTLVAMDVRVDAFVSASEDLDVDLTRQIASRREHLGRLNRWSVALHGVLAFGGIAAALAILRATRREQRARSRAEAAVRTRDEVVSIVSHDLRNPLSAIRMAAGSLLKVVPEIEDRRVARKQVDVIGRAAESMDRIISDLLDVARIESAGLAIEPAPVAVPVLLADAASVLRPIVEAKGQTFVCEWTAGLPEVCVDRDRILQVFSNLVGNAAKFTPAGGTVALTAAPAAEGVRFSVSDTGPGIPRHHLSHLFDRFWQATRSDRAGLGLGLAVVRGIVEAHGSHIEVETALGYGSTFSFNMAAGVTAPVKEQDTRRNVHRNVTAAPSGSRIL